jgi:membrane-associated phospholipid phosphatase
MPPNLGREVVLMAEDESWISRGLLWLERRGVPEFLSQGVFLLLFFFTSLSAYLAVLKTRGWAGSERLTRTAWDDWFPFTPWWTWPYLLPYILGPIIACLLRRSTFDWFGRRATVLVLVSLAVFLVYPTQTVRPDVSGFADDLTMWVYRNMVEVDDPPANAAPSLHVSLATLLALALYRERRQLWWASVALALVVWASTLYTHQHHVVDVVTGAGLAVVMALIPDRPAQGTTEKEQVD